MFFTLLFEEGPNPRCGPGKGDGGGAGRLFCRKAATVAGKILKPEGRSHIPRT